MDKRQRLKEVEEKIKSIEDVTLKDLWKERKELQKDIETEDKESKVGKCFVYRDNSSSCPKEKSDYWNTYYKVIGIADWGLKAIEVEIDSNGLAIIKIFKGFQDYDCYEEISLEEFDKEYEKVTNLIQEEYNK